MRPSYEDRIRMAVSLVEQMISPGEAAAAAGVRLEDLSKQLIQLSSDASPGRMTARELFATWEYGFEGVIRIFAHLDPLEWNQGEPAYSPETQEFIHRCREWVRVQDEEGN